MDNGRTQLEIVIGVYPDAQLTFGVKPRWEQHRGPRCALKGKNAMNFFLDALGKEEKWLSRWSCVGCE